MWRLRPIVGALCAAGLLSGCGGGAAPTAGPTPSALTSQAPSTPAVTSTSTPASASPSIAANSDAAILAAARGYVTAIEAVGRTGHITAFSRVSSQDCNCRKGIQTVVDYLESRSAHENITYRYVEPIAILARNGTNADVHIHFVSGPYEVLDPAGKVLTKGTPDSGNFVISFQRGGDAWIAFFARIA